jgi:hypothetical protein
MLLNNSKSMASVTLGSSSPTYKLADGEVPDPAPDWGALVCGVPDPSSPEGDGDSLGDGMELESPLDSEGAEPTEGAASTVFSSFIGVATGDSVSTVALVADIMNDALIDFSEFR